MLEGHDPYLVALSVLVAILGGYTGFGLAARLRGATEASHRALLSGAAAFLAVGIWTMHFIGMLAAPLPLDVAYLVLPTIVSFLICALVVGVSLFLVSIGEPSVMRVGAAAVLLGLGIVSMHYVGMHGLAGAFAMTHDVSMIVLAVVIAVGAAYGGLQAFLARPGGWQLAFSAAAFGVAVSGMHYTAMYGVHFIPTPGAHQHGSGLVASPQILSLVVALLCFVIAAGFLLSLVPDARQHQLQPALATGSAPTVAFDGPSAAEAAPAATAPPRAKPAPRLPIEGADGTHFIDSSDVRSIRADAHYTRVHDGTRERMCPWSISEAEAQLDPGIFVRVHRSHIVALQHVTMVRKEGDGAVIEVDGETPHRIPVSRSKVAEVKARLGLVRRSLQAS